VSLAASIRRTIQVNKLDFPLQRCLLWPPCVWYFVHEWARRLVRMELDLRISYLFHLNIILYTTADYRGPPDYLCGNHGGVQCVSFHIQA
jgi:hypothetical protein